MIVDTGPIVAAADADDPRQRLALGLLEGLPGPLIVPTPILTEAEYLIRERISEEAALGLLDDCAEGVLSHTPIDKADLKRITDIIRSHPGLKLGLADASVVAQAERMQATTILTFDHRDFRRVRPAHVKTLELLPTEAELAEVAGA